MEATGTDHLDLYFWHAMDDRREKVDYCKSKEFGDAVEVIKKSGKAKFVGFSTHNAGATSTCRPPPRAGSLTSSWSSTARSSNNTDQVCDNLDAARRCEPLKVAELSSFGPLHSQQLPRCAWIAVADARGCRHGYPPGRPGPLPDLS